MTFGEDCLKLAGQIGDLTKKATGVGLVDAYFGCAGIERAKEGIVFSKPLISDGKPNFFKPCIYTYFFGRRVYMLPSFQKAQKKDKVGEFFKILYLNPYSRSSAAWKTAFSKI
jgi:hypothetical protein